jgi:hypothetical protein
VRLVVTDHVPTCDAVIAGTVRSRRDPLWADAALIVFAGGASCAARCQIGANEERSALVIITGASTSCGGVTATYPVEMARSQKANTVIFLAPRWCASVRLASCRTAGASVWSLVQLP